MDRKDALIEAIISVLDKFLNILLFFSLFYFLTRSLGINILSIPFIVLFLFLVPIVLLIISIISTSYSPEPLFFKPSVTFTTFFAVYFCIHLFLHLSSKNIQQVITKAGGVTFYPCVAQMNGIMGVIFSIGAVLYIIHLIRPYFQCIIKYSIVNLKIVFYPSYSQKPTYSLKRKLKRNLKHNQLYKYKNRRFIFGLILFLLPYLFIRELSFKYPYYTRSFLDHYFNIINSFSLKFTEPLFKTTPTTANFLSTYPKYIILTLLFSIPIYFGFLNTVKFIKPYIIKSLGRYFSIKVTIVILVYIFILFYNLQSLPLFALAGEAQTRGCY